MIGLTPEESAALALSLRVAIASTAAITLPGTVMGWALARGSFRGKAFLDAVVHLPLVLPPVVIGYLLLDTFGRSGWLGGPLGLEIAFTWKAAALASVVMAFPLMVRAVRLSVEHTDRGYEEAARTLGAGRLRVWRTITMPLALPGIMAGMILSFARSLGEFGATIAFAGNVPGESRTLPLAIFTYMQSPTGDAPASRLVWISIALSVAALIASEAVATRVRRRMEAP